MKPLTLIYFFSEIQRQCESVENMEVEADTGEMT